MVGTQFKSLKVILAIGCHADDIEIGCAGTLMKLLEAYPAAHVHWVVLSGDERRAGEAKHSAEAVLAGRPHTYIQKTFRDSYFPTQTAEIKDFFHELARQVSPDLILTQRRDDAHQDHRVCAELTHNAFRDHLIWEYEIPKYDGDLGHPNVYVSLTRELGERKVRSIMDGFPSQHGRDWFSEETFWGLMRIRGIECHARYAEGMYCRKMICG